MDPLFLRFIERFTIALSGGMAIYLGYRLFIKVPTHKDSSGKVILPWDISVALTRIGPGVFFALFGVIVIGLSLMRPLEIDSQGSGVSTRWASGSDLSNPTARADARALLRKEIAVLNTFPEYVSKDLPEPDRVSIEETIRHVKLKLMKPVWGELSEGFGEFSTFERWVLDNEPNPPPAGMKAALALYRYPEVVP